MLPSLNPRQLEKAMKKLGIKQKTIEARKVIIECPDKKIIVNNPCISEINALGKKTLQITGDFEEQELLPFNEEDVKIVMEQTSVTEEKAKQALKETNGNIAEAIMTVAK